jgi:hypothetical protein
MAAGSQDIFSVPVSRVRVGVTAWLPLTQNRDDKSLTTQVIRCPLEKSGWVTVAQIKGMLGVIKPTRYTTTRKLEQDEHHE